MNVWEQQTAADRHTKPTILVCDSTCMLLLSLLTVTVYYYSTQSLCSFYHITESRRLRRPRHYSKGVQSMAKAVFCSGFVINTQNAHGGIRCTAIRNVTTRPRHYHVNGGGLCWHLYVHMSIVSLRRLVCLYCVMSAACVGCNVWWCICCAVSAWVSGVPVWHSH